MARLINTKAQYVRPGMLIQVSGYSNYDMVIARKECRNNDVFDYKFTLLDVEMQEIFNLYFHRWDEIRVLK